jgi:hypothetical protein
MRVSALDIIKGAMRLGNFLPSGTAPSGEDGADELQYLNEMMDDLSTRRLFMPSLPNLTVEWPAGVRELTIGPGQDIDIERLPVKFWYAVFKWNQSQGDMEQSWPMDIIDEEQYNAIIFQKWKFQWPRFLWYAYPSDGTSVGKVTIFPVPAKDVRIDIKFQRELVLFAECSTEWDLPSGWISYLKHEMACRRFVEWHQSDPPRKLQQLADKFARQIGVINEQKSHVRSGLTAIAPVSTARRGAGLPQIYFGWDGIPGGGYW